MQNELEQWIDERLRALGKTADPLVAHVPEHAYDDAAEPRRVNPCIRNPEWSDSWESCIDGGLSNGVRESRTGPLHGVGWAEYIPSEVPDGGGESAPQLPVGSTPR